MVTMGTKGLLFTISLVLLAICRPSQSQTTAQSGNQQTNTPEPVASSSPSSRGQQVSTAPPLQCPDVCSCRVTSNNIEVDCSDRGLQSIPHGIPESTTILYLSKNELHILPRDAFPSLPNLEYLYLSQSNIEYLAAEIFSDLGNLKNLDLSVNNIADTVSVFHGLTQLHTLDLSVNNIKSISNTAFISLTSLVILDVSRNEIGTIIPGTFDATGRLEQLFLSSNNISNLGSYMFGNLHNLQQLEMDHNPVASLPQLVFQELTSLQSLYLNYMELSTISERAFEGLDDLFTLSLSGNRLDSLSIGSLMPMSNLSTLILSANRWKCDCQMKELYDWLSDSDISFYPQNMYCFTPPHVDGQSIDSVKTSSFACEPFVTQHPRDTMTFLDSRVEFTCSVLGDPQPEIHWETPSGEYSTYSIDGRIHVSSLTGSSSLIIDSVEIEDAGTYTCFTNNSRGTDSVEASLIIQSIVQPTERPASTRPAGQPDPEHCIPNNVFVHAGTVDDTSIEVEWVPDSSLDTAQYILQVTEFGSHSAVVNKMIESNITLYQVTDLESLTRYVICLTPMIDGCPAVTTNQNCLHATTTSSVRACVHAPVSVAVDEVTETNILVRWSSTNSVDAVEYIVQYNEFSIDQVTLKAINLSTNAYDIQDLEPGTHYFLCVYVHLGSCASIPTTNECKQVTTRGEPVVDDRQAEIDAIKKRHVFEILGVFFATCIGTLLILASIFVIWWRYKKPPSLKKYEFHKETKKHHTPENETGPIQLTAEITSDLTEGASASYFPSDGGYVNQASVIDEGDEIRPYPSAYSAKPKVKPRSKKRRPEPVGKEDQQPSQDQQPVNTLEHVVEVYNPEPKLDNVNPKDDIIDDNVKMDVFDNGKEPNNLEQKPRNGDMQKNKKNRKSKDPVTNGGVGGINTDIDVTVL